MGVLTYGHGRGRKYRNPNLPRPSDMFDAELEGGMSPVLKDERGQLMNALPNRGAINPTCPHSCPGFATIHVQEDLNEGAFQVALNGTHLANCFK